MRISDQSLSTEYRGCGKAWAAIVTGIAIERAKLSPFPKAAEDFYLNGKEASNEFAKIWVGAMATAFNGSWVNAPASPSGSTNTLPEKVQNQQ